jgi:tRNA modification GTPase
LLLETKCDDGRGSGPGLATSATTGWGLSQLRRRIAEAAREQARPALAPSLSRCKHHVTACLEALRRAHSSVLFQEPPELLALGLREALDQLGEMVGAICTDDLLDRIFSRFCIGK